MRASWNVKTRPREKGSGSVVCTAYHHERLRAPISVEIDVKRALSPRSVVGRRRGEPLTVDLRVVRTLVRVIFSLRGSDGDARSRDVLELPPEVNVPARDHFDPRERHDPGPVASLCARADDPRNTPREGTGRGLARSASNIARACSSARGRRRSQGSVAGEGEGAETGAGALVAGEGSRAIDAPPPAHDLVHATAIRTHRGASRIGEDPQPVRPRRSARPIPRPRRAPAGAGGPSRPSSRRDPS